MTSETGKLIKDALELTGTRYELEAAYKHRLLSDLAHALRRAESDRDEALKQSAGWEIQAQDLRDRLVKAEAERDAQHDLVLRLTAERDELQRKYDEWQTFGGGFCWFAVCVATNQQEVDKICRIIGTERLEKIEELEATRDLLTAENARLQKEHNAYVQRLSADALQVASKYQRERDEARAQVATLELLQRGGK